MKLEIYMKSGNVIKINGVKTWKVRYEGDDIVYLELSYKRFPLSNRRRLAVGSINLSQIEGLVEA